MNILLVFGIILIIYVYFQNQQSEKFINSNYKRQKLSYKVKEDVYMNFLGDLNDSTLLIGQKALCDYHIRKEIQSKSLIDAFKKVQEKKDKDSKLFDINIPEISKIKFTLDYNRTCANKASQLCDLTDPMLYISQTTLFPPKWIGPYKNVPLPKHIDLKCWSNMNNCCKTNL
jgi:hypothetical protein